MSIATKTRRLITAIVAAMALALIPVAEAHADIELASTTESPDGSVTTIAPPSQSLGLAKERVGSVTLTGGRVAASYVFVLGNYGSEALHDVQLYQDMVSVFGTTPVSIADVAGSSACPAATFDSAAAIDHVAELLLDGVVLEPGEMCRVELTIAVDASGLAAGSFRHSAMATATTASGVDVLDLSMDGSDPDANGNGDPSDDQAPTTFEVSETPPPVALSTDSHEQQIQQGMDEQATGVVDVNRDAPIGPALWIGIAVGVVLLISAAGFAAAGMRRRGSQT